VTRNHGSDPSVAARPADRMAAPNFASLIEAIGRIDPTLPEIDHPDSVAAFLTALGGHSPR
jgi:hypothetical protein